MSDDERITWDQYLRTALVLRPTMNCSEEELFAAAWSFLKRAWERYHRYRYNSLPPVSDLGAFVPPLIPLEAAASVITGKRYKAQAFAALEEFMWEHNPWVLEEAHERGGLGDDFCAQMKVEYQKWHHEQVREKQRLVGKKTGNLQRKKTKKFRAAREKVH